MTTTTTLHPFISLFSRTTWVSQYQKGKTSLDLSDTRGDGIVECSGISWTICKQCAQITTPTPHHSFLQAERSSRCPTNSVKALKASQSMNKEINESNNELVNHLFNE